MMVKKYITNTTLPLFANANLRKHDKRTGVHRKDSESLARDGAVIAFDPKAGATHDFEAFSNREKIEPHVGRVSWVCGDCYG